LEVEVQVSGQNNGFNVYRIGTQADLVWPISCPFKLNSWFCFFKKKKKKKFLKAMIMKRRQIIFLQTFKGSLILWKENERKEHVLNVTEITYASQNVTLYIRNKLPQMNPLEK
jgi:hypothetical protein